MFYVNMITRIIESETLTKHISYECKCKLNSRKYNSNPKWNYNKCWHECEKTSCVWKNIYLES